MLTPTRFAIALAVALEASTFVSAQSERIWSIFAYNLYGDTVPMAMPVSRALTAYGAQQLYASGNTFRNRYVEIDWNDDSTSSRVEDLSPYTLEPDEINVLSTPDQPVIASAQAFMQGLYPPLDEFYNETYIDSSSVLMNGSLVSAPLHGYQYPQIISPSLSDPLSTRVSGQSACVMYQVAEAEYQASPEVQEITQDSEAFYLRLWNQALSGWFDRSEATYVNAYSISEFLDYQAVHNDTLLDNLGEDDIALARWYADQYAYATNGNLTSAIPTGSNSIQTVAGQTLAMSVLDAFNSNIQNQGIYSKMTLLFGSYEPVVGLTSLMKLATVGHGNFQSRPVPGASIVFELYSIDDDDYPTYPSESDLWVRFLFHNGTNELTNFRSFALFGHGPSKIDIPYSEFQEEMLDIAMNSTLEWCLQCNSDAVFCSGVLAQDPPASSGKKTVSPAVGGVIGAVVTLVVIGLAVIAASLICGVRKRHWRKPSLGGFKGNGKMASDSDVTFKNPLWGDVKNSGGDAAGARVGGHERGGSWELRHNGAEQQPRSSLQNELDEEWQRHSIVEPVRARECI